MPSRPPSGSPFRSPINSFPALHRRPPNKKEALVYNFRALGPGILCLFRFSRPPFLESAQPPPHFLIAFCHFSPER